jgi:hypothetical protein
MLIEQRTYELYPHVPAKDFLDPYETIGLPVAKPLLGGFFGYFVSEFGTMNEVVHMWAYADLEDRRIRRAALAADPEWQRCISIVRPMIKSWTSKILYPTSFSPVRALPISSDEPDTAFTYRSE